MKVKFDIKYRQQIESGEYKVETVDGRQVRIVCWDAHNPYRGNDIVALAASSSGEGENILRYYSNGHLISDSANVGNKDLMVIIPDDDERIRKIITDSVFYQYGAGVEYKDVLDYLDRLEKQKEPGINWMKSDNVKNPDKPYIDKAGMFYTTDGRMCYASEIEKQKEPEKDAETRWENGTLVVDCSKQKPAEWSEKRKKELGDYLLNMIKLVNTGSEKLRHTNDELEKYVEKCVQDVVDLCPISQQSKQEWSEDKYPKNIETDAVMFCFDKGFNITPYQAKTIAKHYYELGFKRIGDGKA